MKIAITPEAGAFPLPIAVPKVSQEESKLNQTVLTPPPGEGFPGQRQPTHSGPHGHLAAMLLVVVLGFPQPQGSPAAYAQPPAKSPEQQVQEQKKKIEETIVQPCKAERNLKAAQIQKNVIDPCSCPAAQQKQETAELNATLQVELQRCEQKGADALDQFKHALAQAPPLEVGKALPEAWLQQFKNEDLRNWVRANVVCRRQLYRDDIGIAAGDQLMITPEVFNYFDREKRINLLAFELGKVFYLRVVALSRSRMGIANEFSSALEMGAAAYQGVSLVGLKPNSLHLGDLDGASQFAYVFRAELLQIPSGNADWKRTQTEFHAIVDPVVRTAGRVQ